LDDRLTKWALVFLAGFIPTAFVNWTSRPIVTEIFLHLPQYARMSAKTAMEYARNLPADARLDLRFLRATTLPDEVSVRLVDTRPAKSIWRPVTFEWVGHWVERGSVLRPNPTQFFVRPESAKGRAAKDTIPGLWSNVYRRLAGVESDAVTKWRR